MKSETPTEEQTSGAENAYAPLVSTAVIGAILYTVDALLLGQGGLIVLATMCGMLVGLVRMATALGRRAPRDAAVQAATFLMWIGFTAGTMASVYGQTRIARGRAETVIAACEAYRAENGVYPQTLQALVPRFLPAVPRARIALTADRFDYITSLDPSGLDHPGRPERTMLMFTTVPPFGHAAYIFETKRWTSSN